MKRVPTILMFALLWAMLIGNLRVNTRRDSLPGLTAVVDSLNSLQLQENVAAPEWLRKAESNRETFEKHVQRYYQLMLRVRDTFALIQERLIQQINSLPADKTARHWSSESEVALRAETVCEELRRVRVFYPYVRPGRFKYISDDVFLPELEFAKQAICYPGDSACNGLLSLFKGKPDIDHRAVLASIRYGLSRFERMLLHEFYVMGSPTGVSDLHAITAIALPDPQFVFPGTRLHASIGVLNYTKRLDPKVASLSTGTTTVLDGVVTWNGTAGSPGWQHVSGTLQVAPRDSEVRSLPWNFRYFCSPRFADISLKQPRAFLARDEDNPISINGSERYPAGALRLECSGGTLNSVDSGRYLLRPADGARTVSLRLLFRHDGQTDTLEQRVIPVRDAALPVVAIGDKPLYDLRVIDVQQAAGVTIYLRNEDAVPAQLSLANYRLRIEDGNGSETGSFDVSGAAFSNNPQLRPALDRLQPGDRIFIEDIRLRAEDGRELQAADAYVRLR